MKKIVCPVDFSEIANNAVEYAANLAKHYDARLTLLHIAEDYGELPKEKLPPTPKTQLELLRENIDQYREMVEDNFGIKCETKVKDFTPTVENALGSEVENGGYDLVVMGTGGTQEISQFFLGTHTSGLIGKTTLPMLIVPADCAYKDISKIVYASDYQTEDIEVLKDLVDLSNSFNAVITVLHVSEKETEMSKEVFDSFKDLYQDKLEGNELEFERVVSDNVAKGIDKYVRDSNADLLVLLTRRYSFFKKLFHESITKNMSFVASYPVLISHGSVEK